MNKSKWLVFLIVFLMGDVMAKEIIWRGFNDVNFVKNQLTVKFYSSPKWNGDVSGAPYHLVVWVRVKEDAGRCALVAKNIAIQSNDGKKEGYKEKEMNYRAPPKIEGYYLFSIYEVYLLDENYSLEMDIFSEKCSIQERLNIPLIFYKKIKKVTFWDKWMSV